MSDSIPSVPKARSHLAGLFTYGRTPDPAEELAARRALAVAKLDREIREQITRAPGPDPVEMAHLVGLLLTWGQATPEAPERFERALREVLAVSTRLSPDERRQIAADVVRNGGWL